MKLILQKDVKNLGKAGDQVVVKTGYARNFLIPKGQALPLNKGRLKVWKHQQVIISAKKRKAVAERKTLIEKLSGIKLKFEKESMKDGRLFGSVTAHEISQALEELHKISVDKRDISFSSLKTTGDHTISIRLDSELQTEIKLSIKGKVTKKREQEEADLKKSDKAVTDSTDSEKPKETEKKPSLLQKAKMAISLTSKKDSEENPTEEHQRDKIAEQQTEEQASKKASEENPTEEQEDKTAEHKTEEQAKLPEETQEETD